MKLINLFLVCHHLAEVRPQAQYILVLPLIGLGFLLTFPSHKLLYHGLTPWLSVQTTNHEEDKQLCFHSSLIPLPNPSL